jgi:hypothetical protein
MEDNIFLDKVLGFLVRDTKIDYDKGRVHLSFFPLPLISLPHYPTPLFSSFSKYCNNVYGLTDKEIEYVWKEFITIIKDKIENGK